MKWSWIAAIALVGGAGCATAESKPVAMPTANKTAKGATPSTTSKPLTRHVRRKKVFLHVLESNGRGAELAETLRVGLASKWLKDADKTGRRPTGDTNKGRYKSLSVAKKQKPPARPKSGFKVSIKSLAVVRQSGEGKIDQASVGRVFRRRKGAIKYCYLDALKQSPKLAGKVELMLKIGTSGRLTQISIVTNTIKEEAVAKCIVSKVRSWHFPPAEGGGVAFQTGWVLSAAKVKQ